MADAPKVPTPEPTAATTEATNIPSFEEFMATQGVQKIEAKAEESATEETPAEPQAEEPAEEAANPEPAPAANDEDPPSWKKFMETGDASVLPPKLRARISKLMVSLGMERAALEKQRAALQETKAPPSAAKSEDGPPELDYTDQETLTRSFDARARWIARKEREEADKARGPVDEEFKKSQAALQEIIVKNESNDRYNWLQKQEGWSDEAETELKELTAGSDAWAACYWDDRLSDLFEYAKMRVMSREKTVTDAKRKAGIPKAVLPRPNGRGVAATTEPSKKSPYEGMSDEDKLLAIARDSEAWAKSQGLFG